MPGVSSLDSQSPALAVTILAIHLLSSRAKSSAQSLPDMKPFSGEAALRISAAQLRSRSDLRKLIVLPGRAAFQMPPFELFSTPIVRLHSSVPGNEYDIHISDISMNKIVHHPGPGYRNNPIQCDEASTLTASSVKPGGHKCPLHSGDNEAPWDHLNCL